MSSISCPNGSRISLKMALQLFWVSLVPQLFLQLPAVEIAGGKGLLVNLWKFFLCKSYMASLITPINILNNKLFVCLQRTNLVSQEFKRDRDRCILSSFCPQEACFLGWLKKIIDFPRFPFLFLPFIWMSSLYLLFSFLFWFELVLCFSFMAAGGLRAWFFVFHF